VAEAVAPAAPRAFAAPNPFSNGTAIHFSTARASHATIEIYDLRGVPIRRIVTPQLSMGPQSIAWDGPGQSRPHRVERGLLLARERRRIELLRRLVRVR